MRALFFLIILLLSQITGAWAQQADSLKTINQTFWVNQRQDSIEVYGFVLNFLSEPAQNAMVFVNGKNKSFGGTLTDSDGYFSFYIPINVKRKGLVFEAFYPGHEIFTIKKYRPRQHIGSIQLIPDAQVLPLRTIYCPPFPNSTPGNSFYTREQIHHMAY